MNAPTPLLGQAIPRVDAPNKTRGAPLSLVSDPELCFGSGAGFTGDDAAAAPAAPAAPNLASPPAPALAAARRRGLSLCLALARTSFTPQALHRVLGPAQGGKYGKHRCRAHLPQIQCFQQDTVPARPALPAEAQAPALPAAAWHVFITVRQVITLEAQTSRA